MIEFYSLLDDFVPENPRKFRTWLEEIIQQEGSRTGQIRYVFCSDEYLLEINQNYLKHNTLTDIITFPDSLEDDIVSGEIFISIPRVRENARLNKTTFENELSRVIAHGVLHLLGYEDATVEQKQQMRAKEDYYLLLQA